MISNRMYWPILGLVLFFLWPARPAHSETAPPDAPLNFLVDISREFINNAVAKTYESTDPVTDVILKTHIHGTGRTSAKVGAALIPNDKMAVIDIVTTGVTVTDTVGSNGPVQLYTQSTIPFQIHQHLFIVADAVQADGLWAHAEGETILLDMTTSLPCLLDRLARMVACRKYEKTKEKAQDVADRHTEGRLMNRALTTGRPMVAEADETLKNNLADLQNRGLTWQEMRLSSSLYDIKARAKVNTPPRMNFEPAPALIGPPYLAVRAQQDVVDEYARARLAGRTFVGDQLEKEAKKLGLSKGPKTGEEKEFSITFTKEKPVEVVFADQSVSAVFRLDSFTSGDNEYSGMNMTIKYHLQSRDGKTVAVRDGAIEAFPPGFKPGQKLSGRQSVMRILLQKRFSKIFKEEVVLKTLPLPASLEKAGPVETGMIRADGGWIMMTWRRADKAPGDAK
jgi:hypothetical protein